jgi:hypothetical protein
MTNLGIDRSLLYMKLKYMKYFLVYIQNLSCKYENEEKCSLLKITKMIVKWNDKSTKIRNMMKKKK